jgi:cell division protein FtsW
MKRWYGDRLFFGLVCIVSLVGIAVYASASLGQLARQSGSLSRDIMLQSGLGLGLGFLLLFVLRGISLERVKRSAPYIYGATLLFTALVFVPSIGFSSGGATRWINLGFTTLQPAEFLKIGYVLVMAWWLAPRARDLKNPKKGILPFLAILALPAIILLAQPNTSATVLLGVTGVMMYFVAGAPWRDAFIFGVLFVAVIGALLIVRPYTLARFKTYLNPADNALGSGYQIQQSMLAIGSGGFAGRGLGQGVGKFNYLPEPSGDSVFAVYAEEMGFVGSVLLIMLLTGLAARGLVIASHSRDLFGGLMAFGFSFLIILQVFMNTSAMLGIIPLTGVPLPFVSHGGTALLAVLAMCGLILNVASHKKS